MSEIHNDALLSVKNLRTSFFTPVGEVKRVIVTAGWLCLSWGLLLYLKFYLGASRALRDTRFHEAAELLAAMVMGPLFGFVVFPYFFSAELAKVTGRQWIVSRYASYPVSRFKST